MAVLKQWQMLPREETAGGRGGSDLLRQRHTRSLCLRPSRRCLCLITDTIHFCQENTPGRVQRVESLYSRRRWITPFSRWRWGGATPERALQRGRSRGARVAHSSLTSGAGALSVSASIVV